MTNKGIWGTLLKLSLIIILVLSFLQVKMKYGWDPVKENVSKEEDSSIQDKPIVPLEVLDALQTDGYLCVKEDSNLTYKYFITKGEKMLDNDIEWEKCKILTSSDTLFPKANCSIYLFAKFKNSDKEDAYSEQRFSFNFPEFVNYLIETGTNNNILHELFSYSFNHTLTISYDNSDEYECEKETDKGRIENLILSIRDDEYYVDSVTLYSNSDIYSNVMSSSYPSIKYINCNSKK